MALLVQIDQEDAASILSESGGKVYGSGGFARAAFISRNGQDVWFWHVLECTTNRARVEERVRHRMHATPASSKEEQLF